MSLKDLENISKLMGEDQKLVQGSGGNISIKLGDNLWIKASGTKLRNALNEKIFISLDIRNKENLKTMEDIEKIKNIKTTFLRPSIESLMHIFIKSNVVLHSHPIDIISKTMYEEGMNEIKEKLKDIKWHFIPYVKPGESLSNLIKKKQEEYYATVYILENHGMIIGQDNVDKAFYLQQEVIHKLKTNPRNCIKADIKKLEEIISKIPNVKLPLFDSIHFLANDDFSFKLVQKNSPFPDHAVFCDINPKVMLKDEFLLSSPNDKDYLFKENKYIIVKDLGVILRDDVDKNIQELLNAQAEIYIRIPPNSKTKNLSSKECYELRNWEAEKYRKSMI